MRFLLGGECTLRDVVRTWCISLSFFLSIWDTFFLYMGLVTVIDIHCSYFSLYGDVCFSFHLSLHVLFLFFLHTHVSYIVCNQLFLFHTKMPWWVLFKVFHLKCFRNTGCQSLLAINSPLAKFFKNLC